MQSLVIYDSYFGNTKQIAQAVYEVLEPQGPARLLHVDEAAVGMVKDVDLLVIGSPTRAFNATKPVKAFIKKIPHNGLKDTHVAAFDTRIRTEDIDSKFLNKMVNWFGYAAEPLVKMLTGKGGPLAAPAMGFFVADEKGPLLDGELERAREWAKQLLG